MRVLVTGGAGFIGSNLVSHFVQTGHTVTVFDNLSRRGSEANLEWLASQLPGHFEFIHSDVRDASAIADAAKGKDAIFHLAAQVAVTSSVSNPRYDFENNALGTFNTLEAARLANTQPIFIYTSTNKVYGGMEQARINDDGQRYYFAELPKGVPESWPLDFHSPYGCSKGAADQYVRDYYRIYQLPTIVFRQSAIYGPRQFGIEDQGWLAHFVICATMKRPFTIYGDGKQVRDLLYVDDLVQAFELAVKNIGQTAGQVYNIGGGPDRSLSVWTETKPLIEEIMGRKIQVSHSGWRPGDQKVYISDVSKAKVDFGFEPRTMPEQGLRHLWDWVQENIVLFEE